MFEDSLENDYYIESINIRIEDSLSGEGYYLTQSHDRGDCGFHQGELPSELPYKLENKLVELWKFVFETTEEEKSDFSEKPNLRLSGKWFQGDSIGEMELDSFISNGIIKGKGEDSIGGFEIDGYLYDRYITFKKSYVNKHSLIYFGNYNSINEIFEGEWFITQNGERGRFELSILEM